ncbi:MAG: hypothetical protein JWQ42_2225 [Edaphobacter sp.]|nr:hypothetical protein [Edaphobacter sp.]
MKKSENQLVAQVPRRQSRVEMTISVGLRSEQDVDVLEVLTEIVTGAKCAATTMLAVVTRQMHCLMVRY